MKTTEALNWTDVTGPKGLDLLHRYLSSDKSASAGMSAVFQAANSGRYDADYAGSLDPEKIYVTTSCHLMVLALTHRLQGQTAAQFYKDDPLQYVRLNCLIQRMLGLKRLTLGWPTYGFGAELLGQTMIYPLDQAPGSDPGLPLLNAENWRDMPTYDPTQPVAKLVRENLQHMGRLADIEPVAHLPAPYSLAAEIFGQEPLIGALALDPDLVRKLLDLIVERVLTPWCDDLIATVPDVWLEMSDASGSPMFVGPEKFLKFIVDPVSDMISNNPWGHRVFVANYRGDLPAGAPTRGRRK
ncbi:MAG: uroporphyrinogen decarboxylase family protein, partial [Paracoccaceae bacterium]